MSELLYPFDNLPEAGSSIAVANGIRWLRMPLPMALDHINLYLLEDTEGWWIVDTGMKWGEIKTYWNKIFDNELNDKPVIGLLITHMHPDHVGQAGWICEKFAIKMHMTFGEYYTARTLSKVNADDLDWSVQQYYQRVGFSEDYFTQMKENFQGYKAVTEPIPSSFQRIKEGSELIIGGRKWVVVVGRGHSPEHACFYCEELGVLISGDQVIPKITSNISVMPSEPDENPLFYWFESLQRFKQFPETTLVLPAHNTPFTGLHTRLDYLIEHHQDHLLALEEACLSRKSAVELLPVLFKRPLDSSHMLLAVGECLAHLNYLLNEKKLQRETGEDGVYYYLSIDPSLTDRAKPGSHIRDDTPVQV